LKKQVEELKVENNKLTKVKQKMFKLLKKENKKVDDLKKDI